MFSSLQCPAGECYKKIPLMVLQQLEEHPKGEQLKEMLQSKYGRQILGYGKEEVYDVLKCLDIPIKDGVIDNDSGPHTHIIQNAMCCDPEVLVTMDDEVVKMRNGLETYLAPVKANGSITGYRICESKDEDGCSPLNGTLMCRMGMNSLEPGATISIDKMIPICHTPACSIPPPVDAIEYETKMSVAHDEKEDKAISKGFGNLSKSKVSPDPEPVEEPSASVPTPTPMASELPPKEEAVVAKTKTQEQEIKKATEEAGKKVEAAKKEETKKEETKKEDAKKEETKKEETKKEDAKKEDAKKEEDDDEKSSYVPEMVRTYPKTSISITIIVITLFILWISWMMK